MPAKSYTLLIKPISSGCNSSCVHCYYHGPSASGPPNGPQTAGMTETVLKQMIRAYMATEQEVYSMVWHGGEPTLCGRSFFEKAIHYQKRYARKGSRISNSIQTNAIHVPNELAQLFGRYRFLSGVSLDGPPRLHNQYRKTANGGPTHHRVIQGITTLTAHGVPVNVLVLVSKANIGAASEVYRYLKNLKFNYMQFIPCVEFDANGAPLEYTIDAKAWGAFMLTIFNEWIEKDVFTISIRLFESILAKLVHGIALDCYNSEACNRYLVVESNGDVYPCDFFVRPRLKLGNILQHTFSEIIASPLYHTFSAAKQNRHIKCGPCEFRPLCMGDCLKFRAYDGNGSDNLSWLCTGWKKFYTATLDRFQQLAAQIKTSA